MSCSAVRHRFENERKKGLTFAKALEIYRDVDGSVSAHRMELTELERKGDHQAAEHLKQHIAEGEALINEIRQMRLQ